MLPQVVAERSASDAEHPAAPLPPHLGTCRGWVCFAAPLPPLMPAADAAAVRRWRVSIWLVSWSVRARVSIITRAYTHIQTPAR